MTTTMPPITGPMISAIGVEDLVVGADVDLDFAVVVGLELDPETVGVGIAVRATRDAKMLVSAGSE